MSEDVGRLGREETFSIIPHWLLFSSGVSEGSIRLYAVLWKYSDPDGRNARPSHQTLADDMAKSVPTVKRWIRELIDAGAIEVTQRHSPLGDSLPNLYTLKTTRPAAPTTPATGEGGGVTHDPTQVTHEPGVGSPVNGGGVTSERRGGVTSELRPRTTLTKNQSSSSPTPPPQAPGSPVNGNSRGGGGNHNPNPTGIAAALTDDPEAFDAVHRWLKLTGQVMTDFTLGRYLPDVRAFIDAGGKPTDDLLRRAVQQGIIREPKLWSTVHNAIPPTVWTPADCDRCHQRGMVGVLDEGSTVPVDHPDAVAVAPCPRCHPAALGASP